MAFQEYDTFMLSRPLQDLSVPVGTRGVVLMVLGGDPYEYEVEFPNNQGGNLGKSHTYTLTGSFMAKDFGGDR